MINFATMTSKKSNFTEVNLLDLQRKKAPKRLIYFSDGVLEEYSIDEEELDNKEEISQSLIDPQTLNWFPYFGYMIWLFGSKTLAACDYLGEHLAWFFGITSPKYQFELEQFEKMAKEEEELQKHIQDENAGWSSCSSGQSQTAVNFQPKSSPSEGGDVKYRIADFKTDASSSV